jgi:DUF917 family protein
MAKHRIGVIAVREVGVAELREIARGAAVFGSGGGGDPYIGRLVAEQAVRRYGPVPVVELDEVPGDALVAGLAVIGAPTVLVEKLPSGEEPVAAFRALQHHLGRPITHVLPIEVGGTNSLMPFVVAAALGLPVVDADCMGRAFPEVQMVVCTLDGIPASPMALADENGNSVVLCTRDNHWAEVLARSALVTMGCAAMLGTFSMSGEQARRMIPDTLGVAERLGRLVDSARRRRLDPVRAVTEALGGDLLFTGKITDVDRRTQGGFARGEAQLAGLGAWSGASLRLAFQNEHLVARRDGEVVATVPDLICVLDADDGEPLTCEVLRYGQRVAVLGAPCHERWRTPEGLALVGPRAFGYDHEHVPVGGG